MAPGVPPPQMGQPQQLPPGMSPQQFAQLQQQQAAQAAAGQMPQMPPGKLKNITCQQSHPQQRNSAPRLTKVFSNKF